MNKRFSIICFFIALSISAMAKEGMWIPSLLEKYNIEEMQAMGFKLTAEDVYSVNHNSMKDAVVLFGRGCTGEMVSDKGLLFTNHHCGYGEIQAHSSVEHDYLSDGFWAASAEQELPNPGLEVRFLDRMDDVSARVFEGTEKLEGEEKQKKIDQNIEAIQKEYSADEFKEGVVKPLFMGNQYFLYVYTIFKDVRLVGAPPSDIGKFGGDTDNWMWPRHTGDFSVFRVYANANNEPAEYSEDNVPYQPKKHFEISLNGYQPDDFVMVFGFPGTTSEYLPSYAIDLLQNQTDPDRVAIRDLKLSIMRKHMKESDQVRIKYAAKYASASNGWKKWQGEIKGLEETKAIEKKQQFEKQFNQWEAAQGAQAPTDYAILPKLKDEYGKLKPEAKAYYYYLETWYYGTDIFSLIRNLRSQMSKYAKLDPAEQAEAQEKMISTINAHFKDYDQPTDEAIFVALMRKLHQDLSLDYQNPELAKIMQKNDNEKLLAKYYQKSVFTQKSELLQAVQDLDQKKIDKLLADPMAEYYSLLTQGYSQASAKYKKIQTEITELQKEYMGAIMSMKNPEPLYPDANMLTMRIAYGKVKGYQPKDGVEYSYQSNMKGIMEKGQLGVYDYNVPQKLKDIYDNNLGGAYYDSKPYPVTFISTAHTTGGNSGSPALNAEGQLIGINFDRCWEGTMSDVWYDASRCRNIMVDIRYVLLIIDEYGGAKYLIDELDLVKN